MVVSNSVGLSLFDTSITIDLQLQFEIKLSEKLSNTILREKEKEEKVVGTDNKNGSGKL